MTVARDEGDWRNHWNDRLSAFALCPGVQWNFFSSDTTFDTRSERYRRGLFAMRCLR